MAGARGRWSIGWRLSAPLWQATRLLVAQGNGLKVLAVVLLGKRQRLGGCHLKRERVWRNRCRQSRRSAQTLKRTGGCVCRHTGGALGLAPGPATPTCGSPSALFPTMTRGRPGLAASTCGQWDECELRGSAQFFLWAEGLGERLLQPQREALKRASPGEVEHQQHTGRHVQPVDGHLAFDQLDGFLSY